MKRARSLLLAGIAVLALGLAAVISPAEAIRATWVKDPAPSSVLSGTTIRLHALAFTRMRFPEPSEPSAPLTPGDRVLWTVELYNGTTHVGSVPHVCTAVDERYLVCSATALLPAGQVQLQTVLDLTATDLVPVSITGGSDCYRYVQGQVAIDVNEDGSSEWSFEMKSTCAD